MQEAKKLEIACVVAWGLNNSGEVGSASPPSDADTLPARHFAVLQTD
jgi:hypothetical protein